jgi:hypothetical protein
MSLSSDAILGGDGWWANVAMADQVYLAAPVQVKQKLKKKKRKADELSAVQAPKQVYPSCLMRICGHGI